MLSQLDDVLKILPPLLDTPERWGSLIINRRRPVTYRAFLMLDDVEGIITPSKGLRVCLHHFEPCSEKEAFMHPHPWPSAMLVLSGQYRMKIGYTKANTDKSPALIVLDEILAAGSRYSMTEPMGCHAVQPLTHCWSIMINGEPWPEGKVHVMAPTTKGKDLDSMTPEQLKIHLDAFKKIKLA
jgi:hypothetical protein